MARAGDTNRRPIKRIIKPVQVERQLRQAKESKKAYHRDMLKPNVTLVAKVTRRLVSHTMTTVCSQCAQYAAWYVVVAIYIVTQLCLPHELINRTRRWILTIRHSHITLNGVLSFAIRRVRLHGDMLITFLTDSRANSESLWTLQIRCPENR
jgi:hypothetical protein